MYMKKKNDEIIKKNFFDEKPKKAKEVNVNIK